ncbi:tetratricopeptide repeat protein [Streptomyces collinus]
MSGVFDRRPDVAASGDQAAAAGRDIGTAVTAPGAIGTQHIENLTLLAAAAPDAVPPAASVDAPQGLTNLPERPRLFVGRTRELDLLRAGGGAEGSSVAQVLHGLGGVGKTTLAAHWAAEHAPYSPVWWIPGDSRAAVDAGLSSLAAAVAPALAGYMQQGQLRDWALQWLTTHTDWLVVLDNVADPADVKPLLAAVPHGRFLITSRRSTGWHGTAERISLETLEPGEAAELFARIAPDAGDGIPAVCAELGCLPLAVEQAAAYCLETGTAADEYLALLADYQADMYTAAVEGGDLQRTIARVWHVTLGRLADDPLAVTILLTIAWYAPEDIPRSLLAGLGSPPAVRGAVGRLAAHSMVSLHGTTSLSVHRLVQAVSRTPDPEDSHRHADAVAGARDTAAKCLVELLPDDARDPALWPVWRTLLPHAEALAARTEPAADGVEPALLFSKVGEFAGEQQLRGRAIRLLSRGESGLLRLLGPDRPAYLVARNRLINLVPLPREEALAHAARCARVLGERHPDAITARYELTASYLEAGDYASAERNVAQVVRMRGRVLGEEHPDTLRARWGALMVMTGKEDLETLGSHAEELLADCVRALGERHPLTLDVRVLRSQLVSEVGRRLVAPAFATAHAHEGDRATVLRAALEQLRGELDPQALREWATASLPEAERRLADSEAALGREHGDTIAARLNMAQMHLGAEDFGNALHHARQAASDAEQYLGAGSPTTVGARMSLMLVSLAARDATVGLETVAWFRRVLERGDHGGDAEKLREGIDGMADALAKALEQSTDTDGGTE